MTPCDKSRYPSNWDQMRADALMDAGERCQGCGARELEDGTNGSKLTTHHPDRDPENPKARLTVLCARCHLAVESMARARQRWHETGSRHEVMDGQGTLI